VRARGPHHRAAAAAPPRGPPPVAATAGRLALRLGAARVLRFAWLNGEEAPPTDQWGPLVSGVRGDFNYFVFYFGYEL